MLACLRGLRHHVPAWTTSSLLCPRGWSGPTPLETLCSVSAGRMAGLTGLKGRSDCREALGRADLRWVSPGGSVAWWSSAGGAGVAAAVQLSGECQDLRRARVGGSSLRGAAETNAGEAAERWRGWGGACLCFLSWSGGVRGVGVKRRGGGGGEDILHKPASPRAAHGCSTSRGGRFGGVGGLASRLVLARGVVRLRPLPDSHHTILRSPHLVARSFISSSLLSFEATMQP